MRYPAGMHRDFSQLIPSLSLFKLTEKRRRQYKNSSEAPFTAFKPHWRASLPVSACVSSSLSLSPHLSTRRGAGAVPWQCRPSDMADALPAAANFSSKPRDRSRRARAWLNHARRCWFAGPGVWHRRGAEGASGFGCRKGLVSVVW